MEANMATKVILVNGGALDSKYAGKSALVWNAVDDLIAADQARGIESQLVKLDDAAGPVGEAAIADRGDWRQAKAAVDVTAAALSPDYLMLLGGPDLLPHCLFPNPAQGGEDIDPLVPSDLPYACDAPASPAIADFRAPTRVVSRLPDVPAASDPEVLLSALGFATQWQSRAREEYEPYLGVSAGVWEGSTRLNLTQLYGDNADIQISPADGPAWSATLLGRRSHFFNLHGAPAKFVYRGQRAGGDYPVAHDASLVEGNVAEGTVAAAEACYGAELFEPLEGQLGMPLAYLRSGAYGFFGSTTIAWGESAATLWADVICRLFQASILEGASVGRAGLEARQEYVARSSPLDPLDLKTIAQYLVLGDPSAQPVEIPSLPEGGAAHGLPARRERLCMRGSSLAETTAWAEQIEHKPDDRVVAMLRELAGAPGDGEARVMSFAVRGGVGAQYGATAQLAAAKAFGEERAPAPATMHLMVQDLDSTNAPMPQRLAVVAVEAEGQLISVKTGTSR
jgi:hypothetical protein